MQTYFTLILSINAYKSLTESIKRKRFFNWECIIEDTKITANAVFSSFENVGNFIDKLDVLMTLSKKNVEISLVVTVPECMSGWILAISDCLLGKHRYLIVY